MEISISFNSIIQVVSLIFFAGGSYVLVQYKLKEFLTRQINIEAEVTKVHDQIKDFQQTSISRKEAFFRVSSSVYCFLYSSEATIIPCPRPIG